MATSHREKRFTPRALASAIQRVEQELDQLWKTVRKGLQALEDDPEKAESKATALADSEKSLELYTAKWKELEQLHTQNEDYKEDAALSNTTVLENCKYAAHILKEVKERDETSHIETRSVKSDTSRRSRCSSRSSHSKCSNSSSLIKAQALAAAVAASEEMIAQRTVEYKTQKAVDELERVKREAVAEADLQILRARQVAAVEKARSEVIIQAEEENTELFHTTPSQSSNDHVEQFLSAKANGSSSSRLRASALSFAPKEEKRDIPPSCHPPYPSHFAESPRHNTEEKLIDLTKHVTNALAQQKQLNYEPDIFRGDPLLFRPWKSSFESVIEAACSSPIQQLTYLAKYTDGDVKELVDRYRHRHPSHPEIAYREVWEELERRFGNKSIVTSELIKRINTFPKLKAEDSRELQTLADLCADAAAQMIDLPGLSILNFPHTLYPILEKLPQHIHNAWRKEALRCKLAHGAYPSFKQFADFLRTTAQMYNDPDLYPSNNFEQPKQNTTSKPSLKVMATSNIQLHAEEKMCLFHQQKGHDTSECISLSRKSMGERKDFCRRLGLCFKCGQNHLAKDCNTDIKCKKCDSQLHSSFMHMNVKDEKEQSVGEAILKSEEANVKCTKFSTCATARSCSRIILAKIYQEDDPSTWTNGYVVLDDQSNACLGDPKLFDKLNLQGPNHDYELSTCGGRGITVKGRRANGIVVESLTGHKEKLPTIIENQYIPGDKNEIPTPDICQRFRHLKGIANYIPELRDDVEIVMLLGRNCPEPLKIRESRNGPKGTPWAQRSDLGWTVSGQICMSGANGIVHASVKRTTVGPPSDPLGHTCDNHIHAKEIFSSPTKHDLLSDIYIESKNDERMALSVEDERFIKMMSNKANTNSSGNLEFPLPFKKEGCRLPNNRSLAENRLHSLLKTLKRKPEMMADYRNFMGTIIAKGHASPVPPKEQVTTHGRVWYLPHFAVCHPKKSSIRVVFDASAEFHGISLNKTLLQGPDQMNSLLGILLRFRIGNVAVMGDIEQMFHNFYVDPKDRDFLRFLWFQDNDPDKPITPYRMNVHLFGSISSPAVATFGLRMVADTCGTSHGHDVTEFIHRDFYVDDGLTSQANAKAAVDLIKRSCEALYTKNLRFHKIVSNSVEVIKALPEGDRAKDLMSVDLQRDELPTQRSLGVLWNLETDALTFKVVLPNKPFSRRGVLSITSSIYDPIGLVAPVSIEGKILLRELLKEVKDERGISQNMWGEALPEKFRSQWTRWRDSLYQLERVHVPRCYLPSDFGSVCRREIHVFSDASDLAIGAVAYLRQINEKGLPHVTLLIAKAKVTPRHAVSIPRLELCAAVMAVSLIQVIEPELKGRLTIDSVNYYTDSKVVLGYISNESKRFHVYVANRVHKIHAVSQPSQWGFVSTNQNPADLASRSVRADQLMSTSWFRGPDFLWQKSLSLQNELQVGSDAETLLDQEDPEVRKQLYSLATEVTNNGSSQKGTASKTNLGCHKILRFSSWHSLRRAFANLAVKAKSFKSKITEGTGYNGEGLMVSKVLPRQPTAEELHCAEKVILKAVQQECFSEEIHDLKHPQNGQQPLLVFKKGNPVHKLNPFLDQEKILRVGGRLRRSDLEMGGRHPVLLAKNSHVSRLIAEHFHKDIQHQGRQSTMAAIRSGGYWILGVHGLVRSIINECITCRRLRGRHITQQMADLPKDRLEATPPFTNVGTDIFGPWTIVTRRTRGGSAESKRWAVIFTCLCSRAVHVEVIESMDTSAFIMALRRFMAMRGPVLRIRCDQGTNFIGAKGELDTTRNSLDQRRVHQFLSTKGSEWIFNPPHASHFGGVWERQIGILRRVLDSMFLQLGRHQLTHEVLVTFMAEACAIVNSRPITSISSDANDPSPLTPNMLLTQKTTPLQPPPGDFVREDLYGRKRWRQVQYLADQFWVRWKKEYLQSLQPRQKWLQPHPNIHKGDVVLLKRDDLVRGSWPLARVVRTYESEDGKVRRADVLVCSEGTRRHFSRPVSELVLIETSSLS